MKKTYSADKFIFRGFSSFFSQQQLFHLECHPFAYPLSIYILPSIHHILVTTRSTPIITIVIIGGALANIRGHNLTEDIILISTRNVIPAAISGRVPDVQVLLHAALLAT